MSTRTYLRVDLGTYNNPFGTMQMKEQVTRTVQKNTLFGGTKYVDVTKEEKVERGVPLLLYVEDGVMREFFTGEEFRMSGNEWYLWIRDDIIPDYQRNSDWAMRIYTYGSRRDYVSINATEFASIAQKWMPFEDEIVKRIETYKKDLHDKYVRETDAADAAQRKAAVEEKESEAWLDSILNGSGKSGKF